MQQRSGCLAGAHCCCSSNRSTNMPCCSKCICHPVQAHGRGSGVVSLLECGPACSCAAECPGRTTQQGLAVHVQLEWRADKVFMCVRAAARSCVLGCECNHQNNAVLLFFEGPPLPVASCQHECAIQLGITLPDCVTTAAAGLVRACCPAHPKRLVRVSVRWGVHHSSRSQEEAGRV